MSVLSRIASALTLKPSAVPEQKSRPPLALDLSYGAMTFFDMVPGVVGEQSNLSARLSYRRDNLAFACMQFRATKLTEPPVWIADETEDGLEWLQGEHQLSQVLEQPNPDMDIAELLTLVSLLMDIDGEVLIVKVRNRVGRVVQLWPYNRDLYTVERASGRLYGKFTITKNEGQQETLLPEDVIYLREPDPVDPYRAVSRVATALAKINLSQDLVTTIRQIMRRGVNPGGIFTFKEALAPEQKDAQRDEIKNRLAGVHNAGGAMILDGDVTYTAPVVSLKDLTTGPAQYDCEAAICQAFQIHPLLVGAKVGMESSAGFADSIAPALKLYYDIAARPAWRKIERKFTQGLLREIDPNPRRFIKFDLAEVQALQESMLERAQTVAVAREVWTVNEGRVYTDLDPLEDERGDMLIAEAARPVIDPGLLGGGIGGDDEERRAGEKNAKRARSSTDLASRHILYLTRRAVQEAHEFTLELAARNALEDDRNEVLSLLRGTVKDPLGPLVEQVIEKADAYFKRSARERWEERMRQPLEALGRHSVQQVAGEIGVPMRQLEPGLLNFIEREVGFLVKHVNETTATEIRKQLREGLSLGETVDQLANRLQTATGFSPERARLIARTESTRATNGAQRESLSDYQRKTGNVAKKEWLATLDDRVREEHERMNGETRGIDETFSNGLQAPGEPNCRCTLLYSIEDAD